MQNRMENYLGCSLSDVRIHTDERAAASARALGAAAFTAGRSIVFDSARYAPRSRDGALLLAHELAHVAHNATATRRESGVAPQSAPAERHADRAAARALDEHRTRKSMLDVRDWGPAWAIHRQVTGTKTKGTVAHSGEVGRAPGATGVPTGTVEVRTGEEIELRGGGRIPNVIALAYSGSISANTRWLQFVWFELIATTPKGPASVAGSIPTTSGTKPFTTDPSAPNWSIDTDSTTSPFYEAGGANLRTASSTTMFDAPGGGSVSPLADTVFNAGVGATAVRFTAHFETYLIQSNRAAYVVRYQASTGLTRNAAGKTIVGAIGYSVGTSGQVTSLPADRRTMLRTAFPTLAVQ
ncbi:MAG: DUF4157 domain-containing protein [Sphingomicrobium sp.]